MEKKKIKYMEGDIFIIELENKVRILGLIARRFNKTKLLLGYFWVYNFEINDKTILKKNNVILISKFSGLGFEIGEWRVINRYAHWNFDDWGFPELKNVDLNNNYFTASSYDDKFNCVSVRRIALDEIVNYYEDNTRGFESLENYLLKITS